MQKQQLEEARLRQQRPQPAPSPPPAPPLSAEGCGGGGAALDALPSDRVIETVLAMRHDPRLCLGLAPHATSEAVRKRYLSLVLRLHPDKCADPRAKEAFEAVEAAYRWLEER